MWENARTAYIEAQQKDSTRPKQSFIEYVIGNPEYAAAWADEETAEKLFNQLQSPALASVSARQDIIRLADMRGEPQLG